MVLVFALGSNGSGQLGIGHSEDVSVPRNVLWLDDPPESVSKIAAGGNHTMLLSGQGILYSSGDASTGACGSLSSAATASRPGFAKMKIGRDEDSDEASRAIRMIAATWEASIFTMLDNNGKNTKVYSCGLGQKGELGQGPLIVRDPRVSLLENFPPQGTEIIDLAACMSHVVTVLDNGEVYGWGNGRKGELGMPETIVFSPRKVEGVDFPVKRAVCGKGFTCLVGDSEAGRLLITGQDKWGIKTEAPPDARGWIDIGAGWGSIYLLKDDGSIVAWGRNDYSQSTPPDSQLASQIAVGSEHVLALLRTGDVLAWGWGEHGNCGPVVQQDGETKGQRKIIASSRFLPPKTHVSSVGAGCATSWIIIEDNGSEK